MESVNGYIHANKEDDIISAILAYDIKLKY